MENSLKLSSKVSGEGDNLILVPGGLTGWKSWFPFEETFVKKGKRTILVQLLNVEYGSEGRDLPPEYSVKTESTALKNTIDSLEATDIDFVAWSYGALTTLDFALDHPELVRTLTLIEPPAIWVLRENGPLDEGTAEIVEFFETLQGDITSEMLEKFLLQVGFARGGQSPRELPQWEGWLPFRQSLRNSPAVVNHRDDLNRLKEFNHPVLLVKGTGSAPFLHRIIDILHSNLPDSRVIELPEGHAPHIVSRDRFLPELENFQHESMLVEAERNKKEYLSQNIRSPR